MLSEAQDRLTLGLEIVSQELAALPAQEWVSLRSQVLAPGVPLLDLQILDCLVWGCGVPPMYLAAQDTAFQLCSSLPHLSEVFLLPLAWPPCLRMSLSWCQARCVEMKWRLSKEGSGNCRGAVGETVSALFTTPHFLPLSGFSNCCCFSSPFPPLPLCPFSLSLSSLLRLFLPSSPLSVRLALPISPSWPPAPP